MSLPGLPDDGMPHTQRPHGPMVRVSGLSSHIALYVVTYLASEKKTKLQLRCIAHLFGGNSCGNCFFLKLGRKNGNNMFFVFFGWGCF